MISLGDPVLEWTSFRDTLMKLARSKLSLKKWACQDWCNENDCDVKELLEKKNKAFIELQNDLE